MDPLRLERLLIALRQEGSPGDQAIEDACALYRAAASPELAARQIAAALSVDRESYARIYELAQRFLVQGEGSGERVGRRRRWVAVAGVAALALLALGHLVPSPAYKLPLQEIVGKVPQEEPGVEPAPPEPEWTQEPLSRESNAPWRRPLSPPPAPWVAGLSLLSALLVWAGLWLRSLQPWRVRAQALAEQVERDRVALAEALHRDLQAGHTGDIDYDLGPPAPDLRLRQATERLAGLRASAPGERLDAEATVDAASRTGGQFVPIYDHSRAPQPLVVLVDEGEDSRLYLPRVEAWLAELDDAGALVEVYRFRGAPEELEGRRGVFPLRTVVRAHPDAVGLLVHGRLAEVSRGELRGWMTPLRAWPRRAWLDPSSEGGAEPDVVDGAASGRPVGDPTDFREVRLDAVNARLSRLSGLPHFRLSPEGLAALARHLQPGASPARAQAPGRRPEASRRAEERRVLVARGLIALVPDPTAEHFATLIDDPALRRYGLRPEHFEAAIPALGAGALLRGRVCISDREALEHELRLRALLAQEPALPADLIERTRRKLESQIHPERQRGEVARISAQVRRTLHGLLAAPAWGEAEKAALERGLSGVGASLLLERLEDRVADPKTAEALAWVQAEADGDEVRGVRPALTRWGWAGLLLRGALAAGLGLAALAFGGSLAARFDRAGVGEMPVDWRLIPPEPSAPVVVEVEPPSIAAPPPVVAAPAPARPAVEPPPAVVLPPAPAPESRCERPKTHPTMVQITPGSFRSDDGRDITLTRPFEIANTEVTQAQFAAVMGEAKLEELVADEYGGVSLRGDDLPMQGVTWYDAVAFCNKLSELEHLDAAYEIQGATVTLVAGAKGYRLPTEAEWEYAARAGTRDAYSGTNEESELCAVANVADQSALAAFPEWTWTTPCDDGAAGLAPVCAYAPNRYSLYDMSGNVWEWTWDRWEDSPTETQDPDGPDSGSFRVVRGGSLGSVPASARVANRGRGSPSRRDDNLGFRPARSL